MKVQFIVGHQRKKKSMYEIIKSMYESLTEENLLKRCLHKKKKKKSRIWKMCPKIKSPDKLTLNFAAAQAIINYNAGYEAGFLGPGLGITNPRIV